MIIPFCISEILIGAYIFLEHNVLDINICNPYYKISRITTFFSKKFFPILTVYCKDCIYHGLHHIVPLVLRHAIIPRTVTQKPPFH